MPDIEDSLEVQDACNDPFCDCYDCRRDRDEKYEDDLLDAHDAQFVGIAK